MTNSAIPRNARILPEHIGDASVLGTLECLETAGIPATLENLLRAPALLRGEGKPSAAEGEIAQEIPEEDRIPELYPPSCGGPQGWLSGIACDLDLFPGVVGADFSSSSVLKKAGELTAEIAPDQTRLSAPYTATSAAFARAAADLCAAGGGVPTLCQVTVPATAAGISALCAVIDAALAFGCELQAETGDARICLSAPALREIPNSFCAAGDRVYFLAAPCCPDTLPDLEAIPAAHAAFRALAESGCVRAARAVGAAGPAESLLGLCGELGFQADAGLDIFAFLLLNFGGIVFETDREIPGALPIGCVSGDGRFTFPDGRGAKVSDLAAYRVAARRARANLSK